MTASSAPVWEEFVKEELLKSRLFTGVCLLSPQQEVIFTYGSLTSIAKEDVSQFFTTFNNRESDESHRSLKLSLHPGSTAKSSFRIYNRTHISVYATAAGNQFGLTVSRVPLGIFITLFQKPVIPHKAITLVENFTEKLRL